MARDTTIKGGGPEGRRCVVFLAGWLAGMDSANADGLLWLIDEVLPRVVESCPWVEVVVTGASPPVQLSKLAGPHVRFLGHVQDLEELHQQARLSVVPIRYGAGVKIKTVAGMQYGVPVVSTSAGAEGIPYLVSDEINIADDPEEFADSMVRLLVDDEMWKKRRETLIALNERWSELGASWADVFVSINARSENQSLRARRPVDPVQTDS